MLNKKLLLDFQFEGVETLDLFKLHFNRLIDPNIFSIKFSPEGILVLRVEFSDYPQLSVFNFNCTNHIENKNPIGIASFFLEWNKILIEDEENYPFSVELFMNNLSSDKSDEEKRKKILRDEESFQYFEPEHVESLKLFGEVEFLYHLYRSGC